MTKNLLTTFRYIHKLQRFAVNLQLSRVSKFNLKATCLFFSKIKNVNIYKSKLIASRHLIVIDTFGVGSMSLNLDTPSAFGALLLPINQRKICCLAAAALVKFKYIQTIKLNMQTSPPTPTFSHTYIAVKWRKIQFNSHHTTAPFTQILVQGLLHFCRWYISKIAENKKILLSYISFERP